MLKHVKIIIKLKMSGCCKVRNLIVDQGELTQTVLTCDPRDEGLYSEFRNYDEDTTEYCTPEYTTVELAVSLEEIIKVRDWLNNRIEKMERRRK